MKNALILGGASCVWDDAAAALELFTPDMVIAVNDIGTRWAGELDIWCTLHHEKMAAWRKARPFKPAASHIGHARANGIDAVVPYQWPGMNGSGSSGLYAVKLALAADARAVLAGVPMDREHAHFFNDAQWSGVESFWQVWNDQSHRLKGYVKSMSGRTMELLGAPDVKWLEVEHLQA